MNDVLGSCRPGPGGTLSTRPNTEGPPARPCATPGPPPQYAAIGRRGCLDRDAFAIAIALPVPTTAPRVRATAASSTRAAQRREKVSPRPDRRPVGAELEVGDAIGGDRPHQNRPRRHLLPAGSQCGDARAAVASFYIRRRYRRRLQAVAAAGPADRKARGPAAAAASHRRQSGAARRGCQSATARRHPEPGRRWRHGQRRSPQARPAAAAADRTCLVAPSAPLPVAACSASTARLRIAKMACVGWLPAPLPGQAGIYPKARTP